MKKTIFFILFILSFSYIIYYSLNYNKEIVLIEENKNIFKNMLLDDVISNYNNFFINEKYLVSEFVNRENKDTIFLYSEISFKNNIIFEIQYDNLNVTTLTLKMNDVDIENIKDMANLIALTIQVSDISINKEEAEKIVINMMQEFSNTNETVFLSYPNELIYTLSILNNNELEFKVK